jgi:hypothetical protein
VCAFICDFDVFFSKYAIDNNHRLLITHSIIPGVIIIILGFLFNSISVVIGGFSYSIHIIIDTFDWGTNFFYFQKKQIGLKLLISKEEFNNISKYLRQYKRKQSFFDVKYYRCKVCFIIETLVFALMILFITLFARAFFLVVIIYFIFLGFHLYIHFSLKKIESN